MSEFLTISQIQNLGHKATVNAFQGTLTQVWDPKTDAKYPYQNAKVQDDDGMEYYVRFSSPEIFQDVSRRGQRIILRCKRGQKGLSGVYHYDESFNNKRYQKLHVTKTAIISYPNNEGPAQQTQNSNTQNQSQNNNQNKTQNTQQNAGPTTQLHIEEIVYDLLRCHEAAFVGYNRMKESGCQLPEYSDEDIRNIGTSAYIAGSKGEYGRTIRCLFRGLKKDKQPEKTEQTKAEFSNWRDFKHPNTGNKLGDYDKDGLIPLVFWAMTTKPNKKENQEFQTRLCLAKAEMKISAGEVLRHGVSKATEKSGYDAIVFSKAFNKSCSEILGFEPKPTDEDQCSDALNSWSKVVDKAIEIIESADNNQEKENDEIPE